VDAWAIDFQAKYISFSLLSESLVSEADFYLWNPTANKDLVAALIERSRSAKEYGMEETGGYWSHSKLQSRCCPAPIHRMTINLS
jgi:hypothetical protein